MACGACGSKSKQLNSSIERIMEVQGSMGNKEVLEMALKIAEMIDSVPDIQFTDVRKIMGVVQGLYPPTPPKPVAAAPKA